MNWDDLRIVRAVFQTGSYAAAARLLKVNETTVPRRLSRLERDLRVPLFDAVDGRRRATKSCEEIVALAEVMAQQAEKIGNISSIDPAPVQRRRITATDSFSAYVLAPHLPGFLAGNPSIAVEFAVSTQNLDLARWEADIAIRLQRPSSGDFVMSKLMEFDLFLIEPPKQDGHEVVCAYPDDLDDTPETRYLTKIGLRGRARCVSKNLIVIKRMLDSGSAIGILPSYMCNSLLMDKRFRVTKLPQRRSAWLLMQRHLRSDDATRALVEWIHTCADSAVSSAG